MRKITLKESELITLIETAMDLDIYSQQHSFSSGSENQDAEDSIESIIEKLKELLDMLKSGKKIGTGLKSELFKNFDEINKTYSNIKYKQ